VQRRKGGVCILSPGTFFFLSCLLFWCSGDDKRFAGACSLSLSLSLSLCLVLSLVYPIVGEMSWCCRSQQRMFQVSEKHESRVAHFTSHHPMGRESACFWVALFFLFFSDSFLRPPPQPLISPRRSKFCNVKGNMACMAVSWPSLIGYPDQNPEGDLTRLCASATWPGEPSTTREPCAVLRSLLALGGLI
jgi:hypothetical protein